MARAKSQVEPIGAEGGTLQSGPVKVTFPPGATLKKIKVGLCVQPVKQKLLDSFLVSNEDSQNNNANATIGSGSMRCSPFVGIYPTGRKFHGDGIRISMENFCKSSGVSFSLFASMDGTWKDVSDSISLLGNEDRIAFESKFTGLFCIVARGMSSGEAPDTKSILAPLYKDVSRPTFVAYLSVFQISHLPRAWYDTFRIYCGVSNHLDAYMEERQVDKKWRALVLRQEVEMLDGCQYRFGFDGNIGQTEEKDLYSSEGSLVFSPTADAGLTLITRQKSAELPRTGYLVIRRCLSEISSKESKKTTRGGGGRTVAHSTWYMDIRETSPEEE